MLLNVFKLEVNLEKIIKKLIWLNQFLSSKNRYEIQSKSIYVKILF